MADQVPPEVVAERYARLSALQDEIALQENRAQVGRVLASYGRGHGHVFNLGHGIHPDVPPEHALAMVEAVHELSPQYHG